MQKDFFDIRTLQEDYDLECKKAAGKSGDGKLPKSFWETYSAMANTSGGYVLLGVEEKDCQFHVSGIKKPELILKDLWNTANNRQKVSENILAEDNVQIRDFKDHRIIQIYIPQANRKQRPVYINGNPLTGTYRRNYEGDYHCQQDIVKQMLGEQTNDTRDGLMLADYNLQDIDVQTLKVYRQNFTNRQPTHPFNDYNDIEFLRNLGGWTKDRQTGHEGLTKAGLLMFGKLRSILDVIPNYIVDYQERPRALAENRWVDRLTTDFSWSGNLYDFYRLVINKLYVDLKVPFELKGDERVDDTPVHEALREAIVNTIIHADYSGRCSILVVKRPDLFGFRNPGLLRIPKQEAIQGGISDCRNRNLQKMFQLVGRGEQAGSGFPKIYKGWDSQHWQSPELEERLDSNQTLLVLRMTSLLPKEVVGQLKLEFADEFDQLNKTERLAMVTVRVENCVTHARLKELTKEHPSDLTNALHGLVEKGLLEREGVGKGTFYYIHGEHPITDKLGISSEHKGISSEHKGISSEHKRFKVVSERIIGKMRVEPKIMDDVIVELCGIKALTNKEIASLVGRSENTVRTHYLNRLCDEGRIAREHPNIKNHPNQKYKAK